MDNTEALLYLLSDSIMGTMIMPIHGAYIYKVMLGFGNYNVALIVAFATLGGLIGASVNYGFGRLLLLLGEKEWFKVDAGVYHRVAAFFQRYGIWAIIVCAAIPVVGPALTTLAGICRAGFLRSFWFAFVGFLGYYLAVILL